MSDLFIRGFTRKQADIDVQNYIHHISAIQKLEGLTFHKNVTFFVGENGTGKSTLLEALAIAYGFNPEGGTLNYNFSTRDTHSFLYRSLHLLKGVRRPEYGYFLRAETFYNVATASEDYQSKFQHQWLHQQSHGESFLTFI